MNNPMKKWQVTIVLLTIILLFVSALPTFHAAIKGEMLSSDLQAEMPSTMPLNTVDRIIDSLDIAPIKLGLDLSGGALLVLEVDTEQALSDHINTLYQETRQHIREERLRGTKVRRLTDSTVSIQLTSTALQTSNVLVADLSERFPEANIKMTSDNLIVISISEAAQQQFHHQLIQQTLSTMRTRIESLGITEAVTQQQGKNRIRIELPGVSDPSHAERIIGTTATLDVYPLADPQKPLLTKRFYDKSGQPIDVINRPVFTGANISSASPGRDEMGLPLVNLVLDAEGGNRMSAFSKENVGNPMVTVFSEFTPNEQGNPVKNSHVINVATIQQPLGSRFAITNLATPAEANELSMLLSAGSLKAPVTIVEKRAINATLGKENVANGFAALALGVGLTLVFMALWYRKLGLIANISLLVNLICLVGLMAWLPGMVLTLPGIAGLVLTVGMAVDTNVLIFERIKFERKRGRSVNMAIKVGYEKAFSTILDANITTLLCALILLGIGYGPIKGFAMTLTLGILTSLFSGVYVARLLSEWVSPDIKSFNPSSEAK